MNVTLFINLEKKKTNVSDCQNMIAVDFWGECEKKNKRFLASHKHSGSFLSLDAFTSPQSCPSNSDVMMTSRSVQELILWQKGLDKTRRLIDHTEVSGPNAS